MVFISTQELKLQSDTEHRKGSGILHTDTDYKERVTQMLTHKEATPGHCI